MSERDGEERDMPQDLFVHNVSGDSDMKIQAVERRKVIKQLGQAKMYGKCVITGKQSIP